MRGSCVEEAGDDPGARPRSVDQIIGTRPFLYTTAITGTPLGNCHVCLGFYSGRYVPSIAGKKVNSVFYLPSLILMQEPIPFSNTNSAL